MNIIRLISLAKTIQKILKVLIPLIEEVFGKDINGDGVVGDDSQKGTPRHVGGAK